MYSKESFPFAAFVSDIDKTPVTEVEVIVAQHDNGQYIDHTGTRWKYVNPLPERLFIGNKKVKEDSA